MADPVVIARLLRSADFERVLATRTRFSSAHFAVHHLPELPGMKTGEVSRSLLQPELSTGAVVGRATPVDDTVQRRMSLPPSTALDQVWLGTVVPKRHARRSVTRSLLKRQMRSVVAGHQGLLPRGLWVVRLRAPFDRVQFPSAASEAIRCLARAELEQLLAGAVAPVLNPSDRRRSK